MPVYYTDLVTPQAVQDSLMESFPDSKLDDIIDDTTQVGTETIRRIHRATIRIEKYLNRELIVRPQVLRFELADWVQCEGYNLPDQDYRYLSWVMHYPVVEITLVDSVTTDLAALEIQDGGVRVSYDPDTLTLEAPITIDAFCGYRREDQGVGAPGSGDDWTVDITAESGLSTLTVQPPLLPADIVGACLDMVVGPMRIALQGMVGVGRVDKSIGNEQVLTTLPDLKLDDRVLANISHHRYEVF